MSFTCPACGSSRTTELTSPGYIGCEACRHIFLAENQEPALIQIRGLDGSIFEEEPAYAQ